MKKVTYHPEDGRSLVFDVLKTNNDGTVNIGLATGGEDGAPLLVVGSCVITDEVVIGSATAIADEVAAVKESGKPAKKKAANAPETPAAPDAPTDGDQNPGDETPQ